jgi:ketosteroid isomerase-like protein
MQGLVVAMPDNKWMEALFGAIDRSDTEVFCAFLGEDCDFTFGNMPTVHGRSAIAETVGGFFASIAGLSHAIEQSWINDDAVICHGRVTYTRHDGTTLDVPFANILSLDGDRVRNYRIYADTSQLYQ